MNFLDHHLLTLFDDYAPNQGLTVMYLVMFEYPAVENSYVGCGVRTPES
jgi:hypothetical protein